MDQLREKLLAHRSFLLDRLRTLTPSESAIAALKQRLAELEAQHAQVFTELERTIRQAESGDITAVRAKIQAIDTLLSGN